MKKLTSPVIKKQEFPPTDFPGALKAVINNRKITKLEWGNNAYYGVLKDGYLMLHKADDKFYTWIISDGDLLGQDWVVLPEEN